jgi:hypothetical protein
VEKRGKKLRLQVLGEVVWHGIFFLVHSRLQVIVFPWGHLDQWILQVRLARSLFREPDFVEALSADAAAEVGMELVGGY